MSSASRCKTRLDCCGIGTRPESFINWGGTYRHGTVFAPRKYLFQKEATGMDRPEMSSASRCKTHTYLCGLSNYPVSREVA